MRLFQLALLIPLIALAGCAGGKHPVRGIVTLDDGSPLTKGLVVFERIDGGPPVSARGEIGADGRYELSTDTPGDGVPAGKYKVLVNPLDLSDVPDEQKQLPFDVKYTKFETSGLECEVKAGGTDFPIKLSRPADPKHRP
ncbi:MAG: carboxypeptidase-like regulatory domain-containing protein [Planctomycetia bacterium]|nr:carboxypeptidase-like regulatory domain-containing protein [Planctomycetia bacterium]